LPEFGFWISTRCSIKPLGFAYDYLFIILLYSLERALQGIYTYTTAATIVVSVVVGIAVYIPVRKKKWNNMPLSFFFS